MQSTEGVLHASIFGPNVSQSHVSDKIAGRDAWVFGLVCTAMRGNEPWQYSFQLGGDPWNHAFGAGVTSGSGSQTKQEPTVPIS
jgi:hypothetical protein